LSVGAKEWLWKGVEIIELKSYTPAAAATAKWLSRKMPRQQWLLPSRGTALGFSAKKYPQRG
jgi:hypothetical protein